MYQLLMTGYMGWTGTRGTMNRTRVFEHTADYLKERFKPGGVTGILDVVDVRGIPALFAGETHGDQPQYVRLGSITNVTTVANDYQVEYVYDVDVPPITQARLVQLAPELAIDEWEFSRNHWAIKDVDLYRVLLKSGIKPPPREPTMFQLALPPIDENLVSVMMPFAANFASIYTAIQGVAAELGMSCQRADDIWIHTHIIQDVVSLISKAKVVICDLSGRNPNVFYEAGIAHAIGAEVILISQHQTDVPFDLQHIRYINYLPNAEGIVALATKLKRRLQTVTGRS
jgi:hypothetical protein